MKKFVVSEESSLKNFTDNVCAQASFCFRALLREREIKVNGKKVSCDVLLKKGDEVCYFLTPSREKKPSYFPIYEDSRILVADKESGVNSEALFCETGLFPVHRLDRNTAGCILLAKTPEVQAQLISAFRERKVEKVYLALVVGKMPKRHEILRAYWRKTETGVCVGTSGEEIVTEYFVLEERGEVSLLKILLHTGKTHQIRAHLAFCGHPVVGDEKYGDSAFNRSKNLKRQQLVSKSLTLFCEGLLHDLKGKPFVSPREL